jgi:hypothetical protein
LDDFVAVAALAAAAGPVRGLLDAEDEVAVDADAGEDATGFDAIVIGAGEADEETRSLTLMVWGAELAGLPIADIAGFATIVGCAAAVFAISTFLSVSSTSAACQPAPVSVVLMASRETPSFI